MSAAGAAPTCGPSCGMLLMGSKEATLTLQLLMTTVTSSKVMELSAQHGTAQHVTAHRLFESGRRAKAALWV